MKKVTYYIYPCDTCCMISERIEINDLDYVMCQKTFKIKLKDTKGIK